MLNSYEKGVIWFIMRLVHYNDKFSQLIRLTLRAGALPVSSEALPILNYQKSTLVSLKLSLQVHLCSEVAVCLFLVRYLI